MRVVGGIASDGDGQSKGEDLRLYESMFLVDNNRAKENVETVVAGLRDLVAKAGGQVVNCEKWDERKLTYEIARQRRGTYVLCHWNGPNDAPAKVERACQLSDYVLRVLTVVDEDGIEIPKAREEPPPGTGAAREGRYDGPGGDRGERRGDRFDRGDRGERADQSEDRDADRGRGRGGRSWRA